MTASGRPRLMNPTYARAIRRRPGRERSLVFIATSAARLVSERGRCKLRLYAAVVRQAPLQEPTFVMRGRSLSRPDERDTEARSPVRQRLESLEEPADSWLARVIPLFADAANTPLPIADRLDLYRARKCVAHV